MVNGLHRIPLLLLAKIFTPVVLIDDRKDGFILEAQRLSLPIVDKVKAGHLLLDRGDGNPAVAMNDQFLVLVQQTMIEMDTLN